MDGMCKSISFLLGAGFSAPIGYPLGKDIGRYVEYIIDKKAEVIKRKDSHFGDLVPLILQIMMNHFKSENEDFNYEDFYEYIEKCRSNDEINRELSKYEKNDTIDGLTRSYKRCYRKCVYNLFVDAIKRSYHEGHDDEIISKYEKFISELDVLLKKGYEINVHTLNHDLLFEKFKKSNLIGKEICDGYEYENTPYKGHFRENNLTETPFYNEKYDGYKIQFEGQIDKDNLVKIPFFNKKWDKKLRLYKLHGSIDQYICENIPSYSSHIKLNDFIDKEKPLYRCNKTFSISNTTPDFLVGKESKEKMYNTLYYQCLIPEFINNLYNSEYLIIIGYGMNDKGINDIIDKCFFLSSNKQCLIYDPCKKINKEMAEFVKNHNAHLISKSAENFVLPINLKL